MKISEKFALSRTQSELDFVDIDTSGDLPLFLDPFFLGLRKDKWSIESTLILRSYFQEVINKIEESSIPYWFPKDRMPEGGESRRNDDGGFTHAHHFYTKRNLWLLSALRNRIGNSLRHLLVLNSIASARAV